MRFKFALVLLAACVFMATPALALDVIGNINADSVWRATDSPVNLTGDVTIAPQATLTIEAGVVIVASDHDGLGSGTDANRVELIVRGRLVAVGTASQRINIHCGTAGNGKWYGISFEPGAGNSSLQFVDITDAEIAVWSRTTNPLVLSDFSVSKSNTGILWQAVPGPQIQRAEAFDITGNGFRIEDDGSTGITTTLDKLSVHSCAGIGVSLAPRVSATVTHSMLFSNGTGLKAEAGSALNFVNNIVAGNATIGLDLEQSGTNSFSIMNNTIDRNVPVPVVPGSTGIGIRVRNVTQASSFVLRNDAVTNHDDTGIKVDSATTPSLDHNNVWGNHSNYTGVTAGANSITANSLYIAAMGSSSWQAVVWPINVSYPPNNYNNSWTMTQPGALAMRLEFSSVNTEQGCDILHIYDKNNNLIQNISGIFSGPTNLVPGDTVKLTFTTDGSVGSVGFSMTGYDYESSTFNYRIQGSSPMIDVGNDLDAPSDDADGTPRPYDGDLNGTATTDIGAYEWHENVPPVAQAGPDHIVLPNTPVDFDAINSFDPDGTIVAYQWNFGDGSPVDPNRHATHSYTTLGTYTVTLKVTDDQGAFGTDTATVQVADNLPPVAEAGPDQFVDVGQQVTLDGSRSVDPDGSIVSYSWNFGDNSPAGSGRTVTHTYAGAGVYTVTLTVTDNRNATGTDTTAVVVGGTANQPPVAHAGGPYNGAPGAPIHFDSSTSHDPDGTIVTYDWDFGDGHNGTGATVDHTYTAAGTYLARLTVTDNGGATGNDSVLVQVIAPLNQPPVAEAGPDQTGDVGQTLHFDGSASHDPDGSIASYAWDFGDSAVASTAQASHVYASQGIYQVRLTVTDNGGATGQDTLLVTISVPGNQPPVAEAGPNVAGKISESLLFDGSASSDPDGNIVKYSWDFGDGQIGTGQKTNHAYANPGAYLVWLTVTDNDGATGKDVTLANVTQDNVTDKPPVANAGGNKSGKVGDTISLYGSASNDPDGTIVSYAWNFGDGNNGAGVQTSHAYTTAGSYLAWLTVTDNEGATGKDVVLVNITGENIENKPPVANAGGSRNGLVKVPITFDGSASHDPDGTIVLYSWDFGDGQTGAGVAVQHTYTKAGAFLVKLTVTDDKGANGSDTALVQINDQGSSGGGCSCDTQGQQGLGGVSALALALAIMAWFIQRRLT